MFRDILMEMNLLNEVDSRLAHEKYYSSIPDVVYNKITLGAKDIDRLTQFVLNGIRDKDIDVGDALNFVNDFSKSDQLIKQYVKKNLASGEYDGADDMILDFKAVKDNGIITEKMLEKEGYIVIKKTDDWIVTCTTNYAANHHYFDGKTKWCTASDRHGRYDGYYYFKYYTEGGYVLIQFSSISSERIYQISIDEEKSINEACDEEDNRVNKSEIIHNVGDELYNYVTGPEVFPVLLRKTKEEFEKEKKFWDAKDKRDENRQKKIMKYIESNMSHYEEIRDKKNNDSINEVNSLIMQLYNELKDGNIKLSEATEKVTNFNNLSDKKAIILSFNFGLIKDEEKGISLNELTFTGKYCRYVINRHPKSTKDEDVVSQLNGKSLTGLKMFVLVNDNNQEIPYKITYTTNNEGTCYSSFNGTASFMDGDEVYWKDNFDLENYDKFFPKYGLIEIAGKNGTIIKSIENVDLSLIKGKILGFTSLGEVNGDSEMVIFSKTGNNEGILYLMNTHKIHGAINGKGFWRTRKISIKDDYCDSTGNYAILFEFVNGTLDTRTMIYAPSLGFRFEKIDYPIKYLTESFIVTEKNNKDTENAFFTKSPNVPVFAVKNRVSIDIDCLSCYEQIGAIYYVNPTNSNDEDEIYSNKNVREIYYNFKTGKYSVYCGEDVEKECDKYGKLLQDPVVKNNMQNWKGYSPQTSAEMDKMWKDRKGEDENGFIGTNRKGWNSDENWKDYEKLKKGLNSIHPFFDYYSHPSNKNDMDYISSHNDPGMLKDYDKRYGYRNWHKDDEKNVGAFDHFDDPVLREFKDLVKRMENL